jgi:predicted CoA-binding protein
MSVLKDAAAEFLAQRRIAVVGVSRVQGQAANIIYRRLRDSGYQVYPVNPNAELVEGDRCYPTLAAIPGGVEAVMIATHPDVTAQIVRDSAALGIRRVWMHRSFGTGSVSEEAVELCKQEGISVIPGACPMMFLDPVDVGHRCMRWILSFTGGLPHPARDPEKKKPASSAAPAGSGSDKP